MKVDLEVEGDLGKNNLSVTLRSRSWGTARVTLRLRGEVDFKVIGKDKHEVKGGKTED